MIGIMTQIVELAFSLIKNFSSEVSYSWVKFLYSKILIKAQLFFGTLKSKRKNILKQWLRETHLKAMDKAIFMSLLRKLFDHFSERNIVNGFKKSGLLTLQTKKLFNIALWQQSLMIFQKQVAASCPQVTSLWVYDATW